MDKAFDVAEILTGVRYINNKVSHPGNLKYTTNFVSPHLSLCKVPVQVKMYLNALDISYYPLFSSV